MARPSSTISPRRAPLMMSGLAASLLTIGAILPAYGTLLVYEGFDYSAGAFTNGLDGGTGWDGGWEGINGGAPTETVLASNLVSPIPHLPSTGGSLRVVGSGDRFFRQLDGQDFGIDGSTIYLSFLMRQLGTAAPNAAVELTRGNQGNLNIISFGSDTHGTANFGANDKNGGAEHDLVVGTPGSALAPDTDPHLWVIQIDFGPGDNDTVHLSYDGTFIGSATVGNLEFDEFGAYFFSGTAGAELDEIRIGTTLDDVAIVEMDIRFAPVIPPLAGGTDASVSAPAGTGTVLGQLSSFEPDTTPIDPAASYTLVAGTGDDDNGLFTMVGTELRTNASLAAEEGNTLSVRVHASGAGYSGDLVITMIVVNASLLPGGFSPGTVAPFLNLTLPTETPGPPFGSFVTKNAFPNLTFNELIGITVEPRSDHLFVLERDGDVYRVENNSAASTKMLVLSVSVAFDANGGFRSMIAHPEFNLAGSPHKDEAFIFYSTDAPGQFVYRLSRVTRAPNGVFGSEQVMIQQHAPDAGQHFAGSLAFDQDGFLIVGIGDMELSEGSTGVPLYQDVQRIDRTFQGAILRLDVDMQGGATSFPATRTLQGGMVNGISTSQSCPPGHAYYSTHSRSGIGYYIPADNYFVLNPPAAGSGGPGYPAHGDALDEHQALGVRNPWRMVRDPVDHDLVWFSVGSNGTERYEEIELLTPGGNYGWPFAEAEFSDSVETGRTTPPSLYAPAYLGVFDNTNPKQTDPLWSYPSTGTGDRAIAGGVMYRGTLFPELTGTLIYGDSASGRIWSLDYKGLAKPNFVNSLVLDSTVLVRQMTAGPQGEKIYLVDGDGVHLLTKTTSGSVDAPALLSETGIFSDLSTLTPAAGVIPYVPSSPLWSDRAVKLRWIALPNSSGVAGEFDEASEKIVFSENGEWTFPLGTVFIKQFDLPLDEGDPGNPATLRRLETRLLVLGLDDVYYGLTYKWRADGTDADLLTAGQSESYTITSPAGSTYQQTWDYPSRQDCLECHRTSASSVLGFNTRLLNHPITYPGNATAFNQLSTLRGLQAFAEPSFDVPQLTGFLKSVALDDPTATLDHRVRSYLDINCAVCHDGVQIGQALFDARLGTPVELMGLIGENPEAGDLGIVGSKLIDPGNPLNSVLFLRDGLTNADQMPPLARNVPHLDYLDELEAWIYQINLPQYENWVSTNGILGSWKDDQDGDQSANLFEFVTGTDPLSADSYFEPALAPDFTVSLPVTGAARTDGVTVTIQDSGDLINWFEFGTAGSEASLHSDTSSPGTDGVLTILLNPAEDRRFVRTGVRP